DTCCDDETSTPSAMTDEPEKDSPDDGTVILTDAPPKLRPGEAQRPAPAAPVPAQESPTAPVATHADEDEDGDVTQVLPRGKPPHESTVQIEAPPPTLPSRSDATTAVPEGPPAALSTSRPAASPPAAKPPASPTTSSTPAAAPSPPAKAPEAREPARAATPGSEPARVTEPAKPSPPAAAPPKPAASAAAQPPAGGTKAAPPKPAATGRIATADDTDRTRVVSLRSTDASTVRWEDRSERPWISLEHVLPPDFAGVERLDKEVAIVGRSLECDVRLYSASASRQHARIEQREDGWYLAPIEGRRVMVD